jgi:hypothetical protein
MLSSSWLCVSSLFVLPRPEDEGTGSFETSESIYLLSTEYSITEDLNPQHYIIIIICLKRGKIQRKMFIIIIIINLSLSLQTLSYMTTIQT